MYMLVFVCPIGSMYAIYGNIYHQYNIPQMLAYIPYMDPMGITYINGLMTVSPRYVEANKHGSFSTWVWRTTHHQIREDTRSPKKPCEFFFAFFLINPIKPSHVQHMGMGQNPGT